MGAFGSRSAGARIFSLPSVLLRASSFVARLENAAIFELVDHIHADTEELADSVAQHRHVRRWMARHGYRQVREGNATANEVANTVFVREDRYAGRMGDG